MKMNLHPLTGLLLLGLAFLFYVEGQYFFLLTTLAIGFLLFVVSLSTPGGSSHHEAHGGSPYPSEMKIHIAGDEFPPDGEEKLGKSVAGAVEFTGSLIGKLWRPIIPKEPEKK